MNIKEIRKTKKLTQEEAASILGMSRRAYQYLESGKTDTTTDRYKDYCDSLNEYNPHKTNFLTNVILGNDLNIFHKSVKNYKKRYVYKHLLHYINHDYYGKVAILYGLRRTGKTTMLFQLLGDINIKKTAYIKIREGDDMNMLIKDLNILKDRGYKYIMIDEVTLLDDFINAAATLSDIYAMLGMKIILSGTDSLGFMFADSDELYDRNVMIHTSYIPFKEFSYLLGIDDIDQYIEYGGTLRIENMSFDDKDYRKDEVSFKDDESTRKYIDTAISRNIQRTLRNSHYGSSFASLRDLYEHDELTNAINRIINDMNHEFLLSVITSKFKSSDYGSSKQLLYKEQDEVIQTALGDIDVEQVLSQLKQLIDVKEKEELAYLIDQKSVNQIKLYLFKLDLIQDVDIIYDDGTSTKRTIFTQPGMRYSITKAFLYSLLKDKYFDSLNNNKKKVIIDKIISDIKGRMLEDIVLLDTFLSQDKHYIFKYRTVDNKEIDMVDYDEESMSSIIYEIKHSKEVAFVNQTKYLNDEAINNNIARLYGPINSKNVLYRGESKDIQSIKYINVEEYLKSL